MDFSPSDRVRELRDRLWTSTGEHVLAVEAEAVRALDDEVGRDSASRRNH